MRDTVVARTSSCLKLHDYDRLQIVKIDELISAILCRSIHETDQSTLVAYTTNLLKRVQPTQKLIMSMLAMRVPVNVARRA